MRILLCALSLMVAAAAGRSAETPTVLLVESVMMMVMMMMLISNWCRDCRTVHLNVSSEGENLF